MVPLFRLLMGKSKARVASEARGWRLLSERHAADFMPCLSFSLRFIKAQQRRNMSCYPLPEGLIGPLFPYQICAHFSGSVPTEWPRNVIVSKYSVEVWHVASLLKNHPSISDGFWAAGRYVWGQCSMHW